MKKNISIILMAIAVIVLLFLVLGEPRTLDSHKDDYDRVVAEHDTLRAHGVEYQRINDSLVKDNHRLDSANKSLVNGQQKTQRKLDGKAAEVSTLLAQIREINQDTGYFGHLLDSLQQQVESLTFLIVQYEQYADSINNVNDSLKINNGATVKEKDKRIAELQTKYDALFATYTTLFSDYSKSLKTIKRERLKTKIAALLGLVGGAAAVLK